MGRVDPGTARVTAVTPLEELDTAVTTLAVGAGGVWVGGALYLSSVPRVVVVDRIDPPSGRLVGVFTLARATEGLLVADQDSLWFAAARFYDVDATSALAYVRAAKAATGPTET